MAGLFIQCLKSLMLVEKELWLLQFFYVIPSTAQRKMFDMVSNPPVIYEFGSAALHDN
jgi:hypothetical protein